MSVAVRQALGALVTRQSLHLDEKETVMSIRPFVSRALALGVLTAAGLAGPLVVAAPAADVSTPFTFQAYSYGTSIRGGSLPASSGRSAYALISCTNLSGRHDGNNIAGLDLAGLQVGAITSSAKSYRTTGAYHASGLNQIASVVAGSAQGPHLTISGLRAYSHSWHDGRGFHGSLSYGGVLAFTPLAGAPAVRVPFPAEGKSVPLPGLGTVAGGTKRISSGATFASASGYSLKLHLDASSSDVLLGHTSTVIRRGMAVGVMSGRAFGSQVHALAGGVTSGPSALRVLPCNGTNGEVRSSSTASLSVPGVVAIGATDSRVRGVSARTGAGDAWTRSTVARVELGGGRAVITGIHANAHVHKTSRGVVTRDVGGTTPGDITVNGQTHALPAHGSYEVPGLARIDTRIVSRTTTSVRVVAVRVTLLSGGGNTVIDLGNAVTRIARH